MKTSEAERSTGELSLTVDTSVQGSNLSQKGKQRAMDRSVAAPMPKRSISVMSQSDWPLPEQNSETHGVARSAPRRKPNREVIDLLQKDMEALDMLQARCKELGIKMKKATLLAAGLQLLTNASTGKLLAILGPLEASDKLFKRRKKKAPVRA